jgi:L-ribulose-5-phosphate 4-epimerase
MTWGNASGIDRERRTGGNKTQAAYDYERMKPGIWWLSTWMGRWWRVNGSPHPIRLTHLVLYRNFQGIGGVVHTHAEWATSWAQSGRDIPVYGTTHAD